MANIDQPKITVDGVSECPNGHPLANFQGCANLNCQYTAVRTVPNNLQSDKKEWFADSKCTDVKETTVVTLLERLAEVPAGTKLVYRIEDWLYPNLPVKDNTGSSQLWYFGATKEQVPTWLYSLLLRADFHKGDKHRLKELFRLEHKELRHAA